MTDPRLAETLTLEAENISYLQTLPDVHLQKKLRIIREQQSIAWQQKNERALALLEVWECQVIEARYLRNEKDAPAFLLRKKESMVEDIAPEIIPDEIVENVSATEPVSYPGQLAMF